MTLDALETGMSKIESSLDRKQLINIMLDMIKSGKIASSRVLHIILNNIDGETAEDVIVDTLRFIVPICINRYGPIETFEQKNEKCFQLMLSILESGKFANS